jgi:mono/diheme cytochrome c family protein
MRGMTSTLGLGAVLLALTAARSAAAQQPDGQAVFRENCKSCHGINGVPPERERAKYKKLRTLGDSGFVARLSQDSIVKIVTNGIDKNMKSFKDKLSPEEIRAAAAYIKELAEKKQSAG